MLVSEGAVIILPSTSTFPTPTNKTTKGFDLLSKFTLPLLLVSYYSLRLDVIAIISTGPKKVLVNAKKIKMMNMYITFCH